MTDTDTTTMDDIVGFRSRDSGEHFCLVHGDGGADLREVRRAEAIDDELVCETCGSTLALVAELMDAEGL